jgi:hypothetical protein
MARVQHSPKQIKQRKLAWILRMVVGFSSAVKSHKYQRELDYTTRSVLDGLYTHLLEIEEKLRKDLKSL